jgi:hypothetical protein
MGIPLTEPSGMSPGISGLPASVRAVVPGSWSSQEAIEQVTEARARAAGPPPSIVVIVQVVVLIDVAPGPATIVIPVIPWAGSVGRRPGPGCRTERRLGVDEMVELAAVEPDTAAIAALLDVHALTLIGRQLALALWA